MTTNYLTDLMKKTDAKAGSSFKMLVPNGKPLPKRICKQCAHYRDGGECPHAKRGVTSPLQDADDKRCFVPRGADAKVHPVINDTPEVRAASKRRREQKAVRKESVIVAKKEAAPKEKKSDGRRKPIPTHKVCMTCGRDLPMDAFPVSHSKYKRDGHFDQCAECRAAFYESRRIHRTPEEKKAKRAESDRKYYERVKAKQAEAEATNCSDGVRVCQRCGRTLPLEEFQVNKRGTRFHACRECMHEAHVKGGSTGGRGRPKNPRLTFTQQLAQGAIQDQPVTDRSTYGDQYDWEDDNQHEEGEL